MYAITGITGQVGGGVARALLATGAPIRAVLRNPEKAREWAALGCEIAQATVTDAAALTRAFTGTEAVFLMIPPEYDPEPGLPGIHAALDAIVAALRAARPGRVVLLSTVGAHVRAPNLLNWALVMEAGLRDLGLPTAFLRAAWFMENAAWDVTAARTGTLPSFLQPLDHPIPMVATADIAQLAADLLGESWTGTRIVELEYPRRYAATDIAAGFAAALGHDVHLTTVPRGSWEDLFRHQGMRNPTPRMRMLDGFNEGWIDFEGGTVERRYGQTRLETVLRELVARTV